ncbi:MAG: tetratricopeptide repeat protein [Lachnospiraceae bacterium]|nr:tetratricopeptide repeat protein [Ruminococcus sp.]MCM1275075.1 tetratricopeptide repeat protein [Lachnospiraceae bacterium]
MNNKDRNKFLTGLMSFIIGCFMGVVIMLLYVPDDVPFLITLGGMFGFSAFLSLIMLVLTEFVIPCRNKRNAAARALGKDGIKIMRHDETAKLAYKGIYAIMSGKYPQAEEYLQKSLAHSDIRQNQMFCIEWLIRLYEAMENESKLLWCYRKAVEYSPDNPEAQSRLGHAYFADGKLDQAMYCFEQALRYDPNNGYSYFSIAKIQLVRGEDEKAFETLQNLVRINENHPLCHAELADYYAMKGDREKAEEECKKAQLCGIKEPEELNKRINAMLSFHETEFSGGDLPTMYYRRIEKAGENNG